MLNDSSLFLTSESHLCVSFDIVSLTSGTIRTVEFLEIAGSFSQSNYTDSSGVASYTQDPFIGQSLSRWSLQTVFRAVGESVVSEQDSNANTASNATSQNTSSTATKAPPSPANASLLSYILQDTLKMTGSVSCVVIACLKGCRSCFNENAAVLDVAVQLEERYQSLLPEEVEEEEEEVQGEDDAFSERDDDETNDDISAMSGSQSKQQIATPPENGETSAVETATTTPSRSARGSVAAVDPLANI
eukprot:gene28750-35665_t